MLDARALALRTAVMMLVVKREVVAAGRLIELVDGYSRQIYPAVLKQQRGAVVCSPLGMWLLLAACASVAEGENRRGLERVLGCSGNEAVELLSAFVAAPPAALRAAIAIWVGVTDASEPVAAWVRGLPSEVESGFMPTQQEADAWVERNTLGLIKSFPQQIDAFTRIVLASALATKVSWEVPFELAAACDHLGAASPWRGSLKQLLRDRSPGRLTMIASTRAAGLVSVHTAVAREDLSVVSVSADPGVPREAVLDAVHELSALARGSDSPARPCSLFDLALGAGHSWEITEREVRTRRPGERVERIIDALLPAWRIEGEVDLLSSPRFGSGPALEVLRELVGPRANDRFAAKQIAVASYTRFGFEAAAITAFTMRTAAIGPPRQKGVERTATLRFDHPYAVVALAGSLGSGRTGGAGPEVTGLALFTAWVAMPEEPADELPAESEVPHAPQ